MPTPINAVLLEELSGGTQSSVKFCSADGTIAYGWSNNADGTILPVTWNPVGSPPTLLATPSGVQAGQALTCGRDGSVAGGGIGTVGDPTNSILDCATWHSGTVTDLGMPGGSASSDITASINTPSLNDGFVWFGSTGLLTPPIAGLFIGGVATQLTLPGGFNAANPFVLARGVTSPYLAVGGAVQISSNNFLPFMWQGATPTALPLPGSDIRGYAVAADDAGTIAVGVTFDGSGNDHATAWTLSGPTATLLSSGLFASYITPSTGVIVGNINPGFNLAAYWTSNGAVGPTLLPPLAGGSTATMQLVAGRNPTPYSGIYASDDGTKIVGFADDGLNEWPIVWISGVPTQLLILPGTTPPDSGDTGPPLNPIFIANNGANVFGQLIDSLGNQRAVYWPLGVVPVAPTGSCGGPTYFSVTFQWTPDPSNPTPDTYTLQYRQLGTTVWTVITGLLVTSYTVAASQGETFQWQVQAVYGSSPTPFSIIYDCTASIQFTLARQGILGDYRNGNLYTFDPENLTDNGVRRRWLRSWRALEKPREETTRFSSLRVDLESGTVLTPAGTNPQCVLRWSDDGGHAWSNERILPMGKTGETAESVKFNRLGSTRRFSLHDRIFELSGSDLAKVAIVGADVDVS